MSVLSPLRRLAALLILSLGLLHVQATCRTAVSDTAILSKVYIIGCVHSSNGHRNADSLLMLLRQIKPDLILDETDTLSGYFEKDYTLVQPNRWYRLARRLRLAKPMPPESEVMYLYRAIAPDVSILPFDVPIPRRNRYIRRTTRGESAFVKGINRAYKRGEIMDSLKTAHNEYVAYSAWLWETTEKGYKHINRPVVSDSIRNMYRVESDHLPRLLDSVDRLERHRDWLTGDSEFWRARNEGMARNILRHLHSTKARTTVVFTGLLHKYYLIDLLGPVAAAHGFELAEYPDESMHP